MLSRKKGLNAELSGFYRHKAVDQLAVFDPVYLLSIGLQKQVMNGKQYEKFTFPPITKVMQWLT